MDATQVSSTYKQYKAASTSVTTWLANTAVRCGFNKNKVAQSSKAPKQKVKTRKQRKAARDAADKGPSETTLVVLVCDLVPMAECVAKIQMVRVPKTVSRQLDATIALRKEHRQWLHVGNGDQDPASDARHTHFIDVLQKVRRILAPLADLQPEPSFDAAVLGDQIHETFINAFECLSIEEPDEPDEAEGASRFAQHTSPSTQPSLPKYVVEQEIELAEAKLAAHCLFLDLNKIRMFLQDAWIEYKLGTLDLIPVSLVTNMAVGFAQLLVQEFEEAFPGYSDEDKLRLGLNMRLQPVQPDGLVTGELADMAIPMHEDDLSSFATTYVNVVLVGKMLGRGDDPMIEWLVSNPCFSTRERAVMDSREAADEDLAILLAAMSDLRIITKRRPAIAEDEFTRLIRDWSKVHTMTLNLCFAAQIFLDINHMLRAEIVRGMSDLQTTAARIKDGTETSFGAQYAAGLGNIRLINEIVYFDPISWCYEAETTKDSSGLPPVESFRHMKEHPWACGLFAYLFNAEAQREAVEFQERKYPFIMYYLHLYNALRQQGLLKHCWPDMDMALSLNSVEQLFVGDIPRDSAMSFKHLVLATGGSALMFTRLRRNEKERMSDFESRKSREIMKPQLIADLFTNRLHLNKYYSHLSPADLYRALGTHAGLRQTRGSRRTAVADMQPVKLLDQLLHVLAAEMPFQSFNYLALHNTCRTIGLKMSEGLRAEVIEKYKPYFAIPLPNGEMPPWSPEQINALSLPTFMLSIARLQDEDRHLWAAEEERILSKAAKIMDEVLSSDEGALGVTSVEEELDIKIKVKDIIGESIRARLEANTAQ